MPQRIFIVEDDPDIRNIVTATLAREYEVRSAEDGLAALLQIEGGLKPDLIIADIMMPRLDGLSLVGVLKKNPVTAGIPVMFLTAKGSPQDVIEGINIGARCYLTKPFDMDDLLQKVHRLLPLQRK